jgi:acetyltransferase-like isoleucine patch superfamily enzyme
MLQKILSTPSKNWRGKTWKKPKIKDKKLTRWNWLVQYAENFEMGYGVDISSFCVINAKHGVKLEDNVQIGPHCAILSASTIDNKKGCVVMKKGSCLGTHSTIMPGVTIGENSIVGAYSFVNKDIPPNVIAWGVPAKVIRENTII